MSDTIWTERKPGELRETHVDDVSDQFPGEGSALLMYSGKPDWVRHPVDGRKMKCLDQKTVRMTCPLCRTEVVGELTFVEEEMKVLECSMCKQFVWFK